MKDVTTLTPGDRVALVVVSGRREEQIDTRTYSSTYLGHTDTGFTIRVGAMTVERTYRWESDDAWIADPRTDEAYVLPEPDDDVLESIPPDLE